jgi:hypothetical protein
MNAYVYITLDTTPVLYVRKNDLVMRDRRISQFVG